MRVTVPNLRAATAAAAALHAAQPALVAKAAEVASAAPAAFEPRGITPEDTVIFLLGCVPFVWAGSACMINRTSTH